VRAQKKKKETRWGRVFTAGGGVGSPNKDPNDDEGAKGVKRRKITESREVRSKDNDLGKTF